MPGVRVVRNDPTGSLTRDFVLSISALFLGSRGTPIIDFVVCEEIIDARGKELGGDPRKGKL